MRPHTDQAESLHAVEQVLLAERAAQERLVDARLQAQRQLESARADALAIVDRALERSAHWQATHAAALEQRLQEQRRQALAASAALPPYTTVQIAAAVQRVAAQLTGPEAIDDCSG